MQRHLIKLFSLISVCTIVIFLFAWNGWWNVEKKTLVLSTSEHSLIGVRNEKEQILQDILQLLERPLGPNKLDPVISMHVDFLKRNGKLSEEISFDKIQNLSRKGLELENTKLMSEEMIAVDQCKQKGENDYQKNYALFFHGKGKGEIRRTHHTYLNRDSLLVELGGNWGWDAGNFTKMYGMRHVILEPLGQYVKILQKKFQKHPEVSVYELGVGAKNEKLMVAIEGNNACATSKFSKKKGSTPIFIINAIDLFTFLGIGVLEVDLLSMNCEGCEYETLETMLKYNIINKFRNIQWATHTRLKGLPNPFGRYCAIQELLKRTHRPTYQYKFNWESWRRKDLS